MLLVRLQPARSFSRVRPFIPRPILTQTMAIKPAVELENREKELILRAAVPGLEGKDLEIRVARQAVAISGEYRSLDDRILQGEFQYGKLERVVRLPVAIAPAEVRADLNNGILTLTLPKASASEGKAVKVELPGSQSQPLEVAPEQPLHNETKDLAQPVEEAAKQPMDDETEDVWAA